MRLKCATWRPVAYKNLPPRTSNKAIVAHTNGFAAPGGSLFSAWSANAATKPGQLNYHVGSHVQVMSNGLIEQYIDTDWQIGHAYAANSFTVGVETEDGGDCSKPWTPEQITSILAIATELGVPA